MVLVLQEGRSRCKKTSQVRDDRGLEQGGRDEHEEKWPYLGNILETEQQDLLKKRGSRKSR